MAHHGIYPHDIAPPKSKYFDSGRFGRIFGKLPPFAADTPETRAALMEIGKPDGIMDAKDKLAEGPVGTAQTLAELKKAGVPVLAYGNFITITLNFAILAFIIFLLVKQMNKLRKAQPAPLPAPSAPSEDVLLLTQIRDLLKARG